MKLLLDFPTIGEPHYAQAHPGQPDQGQAGQVLSSSRREHATRAVTRDARPTAASRATASAVDVKMIAIRSHFAPDNIEGVQVGDTVLLPRHQHRAGLGHPARLRRDSARNNVRADPVSRARRARSTWMPKTRRRLPVLLHRLLLGAAPGDAGLHPGVAGGVDVQAAWRTSARRRRRRLEGMTRRTGRQSCRSSRDCSSSLASALAPCRSGDAAVAHRAAWRRSTPRGSGCDIWINQIRGATPEHDLHSINWAQSLHRDEGDRAGADPGASLHAVASSPA